MNKFQAALFHARPLVEQARPYNANKYICNALGDVARRHPNLAGAVRHIKQNINVELGSITFTTTLWGWVNNQGTKMSHDQAQLARLAWIDKLMEWYK